MITKVISINFCLLSLLYVVFFHIIFKMRPVIFSKFTYLYNPDSNAAEGKKRLTLKSLFSYCECMSKISPVSFTKPLSKSC